MFVLISLSKQVRVAKDTPGPAHFILPYYSFLSLHNSQQSISRADTAALITEFRMFEILDKRRNTATGMDLLPAWFLRLGAPVFCGPLIRLFNNSIVSSTVPKQWKSASITPVPKTAIPQEHTDFRPISITSVLSRTFERVIVREFIYPAILEPPAHLSCADQCFPANWIDDCSYCCHSPVCYGTALVQLICSGHHAGLQQGF